MRENSKSFKTYLASAGDALRDALEGYPVVIKEMCRVTTPVGEAQSPGMVCGWPLFADLLVPMLGMDRTVTDPDMECNGVEERVLLALTACGRFPREGDRSSREQAATILAKVLYDVKVPDECDACFHLSFRTEFAERALFQIEAAVPDCRDKTITEFNHKASDAHEYFPAAQAYMTYDDDWLGMLAAITFFCGLQHDNLPGPDGMTGLACIDPDALPLARIAKLTMCVDTRSSSELDREETSVIAEEVGTLMREMQVDCSHDLFRDPRKEELSPTPEPKVDPKRVTRLLLPRLSKR
jgi:hypothetical protein